MWFRQCSFFRLGETPDAGVLEEALAGAPFGPCLGLDVFSDGFVAPVSHSPAMVFKTGSVMGISLKREEKVLPVGVIRAQLDKKVAEIEEAEGRKVGRREKQELKEKISDDLLMRAFTQESRIAAVLAGGYLLVNQSSPAKAEHLLYRLREALGGLNAERPQPNRSLSDLMTGWLMRGEADGQFELGDYAALRGVGDAAPEISIKRQDLTAEEVAQHVKNGKRVAELGLVWREQVEFVLAADFTLKRIRFYDGLLEEAQIEGEGSADGCLYAVQLIMANNLTEIIGELAGLLGGWRD